MTMMQNRTMPHNEENRLTSERHAAFCDALESLYIKGNQSGRLHFAQKWPQAARHVFGAELMGFDKTGTQDKDRRAALEEEAEERRVKLAEIVTTLEKRCVVEGVLDLEYVRDVALKFGREMAGDLFAPRLIDRIFPPQEEKLTAPKPVSAQEGAAEALPVSVPKIFAQAKPKEEAKKPLNLTGITDKA